jgi:predicted phosphodiesterase
VRYAVISDIHANLEAFQKTLEDIDLQNVDEIICLGDLVGYYPNPNECVELCKKHQIKCIRGNHDDAAIGICGIEDFNPVAQKALIWTSRHLDKANKEWLSRLPELLVLEEKILMVHGSPWHPYAYIFSAQEAVHAFAFLQANYPQIEVCFYGHTHQKALYYTKESSVEEVEKNRKYILGNKGLYLINPGSVGQPRDGSPGAFYAIYDSQKREVEFRHLTYDLTLTQRKVIEAGLPSMLAERLIFGY